MKRFFTFLLFGVSLLAWPALAQEVDEDYVFVDEDGNVVEDGATVVRNSVETADDGSEVIYSGISVKKVSASADDYIKMYYVIERIDNGTYQLCFPTTCNMKTEEGFYETTIGQLMSNPQNIQSEWFPTEDGECIVTLSIEIYNKSGGFPPTYVRTGDGPTITLRFVKGDTAPVVDGSFVFIDENGNIVENGATVVRDAVETAEDGSEVIYSGISVKNVSASADDYIKMRYVIEHIDNGTYQLCFPTTCNMKTEEGFYETTIGQLMSNPQDIQSEWFPTAQGECVVTLSIEIYSKMGGFPPTYNHKADGPTITLRFVKGSDVVPVAGDVNGDGEVNIADVNAVIDRILKGVNDESGDVNHDGEVNIADVNAIIDIILN